MSVPKIGLVVLILAIAWMGFRLGTYRHTPPAGSASSGPPHSVHLSWVASTSPVVGYNVYRRGTSGLIKINSELVTKTSYVDSTVQPGQTYYYVTRAVNSAGTESRPSNEVQAVVPPR